MFSFSSTCGEQAQRLKGPEDVKRRIGRCDSVVLKRHGVEPCEDGRRAVGMFSLYTFGHGPASHPVMTASVMRA